MKKYKLILILFIVSFFMQGKAQSLFWNSFNVAGKEVRYGNVEYSYSIGQVFCDNLEKTTIGYQQNKGFAVVKPIDAKIKLVKIKAYPNPVKDFVNFEVYSTDAYTIKVFDDMGRFLNIKASISNDGTKTLYYYHFEDKEKGIYIFHVYKGNCLIAISKIIKI